MGVLMPDGVNWGLATQPLSGLQALQYYGQAQQDQLQRAQIQDAMASRQMQQQVRQQQIAARPEIAGLVNAGDFGAAQTRATAVGDYDFAEHIGRLDANKRKQAGEEAELLGRAAFALKRIPAEQRTAALAAMSPRLKASGYFSDDELAAASHDLSDGILDGYISTATALKDQLDAYNDANKPMVVGSGSAVLRDGKEVYRNPVAPEYVLDQESGDWLLKPGTGGGGAAGAVPGAAPGAFSNGAPQQAVSQTLTQAGIPTPVVAGFLGNFDVEGGYGGARGDGGSAAGIAQWRGERQANFRAVMGKDVSQASPAEQAQFVVWEMQNPERAGMTTAQRDAILSAQSPQQAAELIDQHYERSSGQHRQRRVGSAQAAFGALGSSGAPQSAPQQPGGTPARIPSGRGPKRQAPPSGFEYAPGGGLQPMRGGPSDPSGPGEAMKSEASLRKEFDDQTAAKDIKIVRPAFETLARLANGQNERLRKGQEPSAADDIALVFAYMKILDPNSVVREAEFATAQNSGGIPDQVRNAYNKAKSGAFLQPGQRAAFVKAAQQAYETRRLAYNDQADRYRELAREYGVNENRIAPLYLTAEERQRRQQQRGGGGDAVRLKQKYGLR